MHPNSSGSYLKYGCLELDHLALAAKDVIRVDA